MIRTIRCVLTFASASILLPVLTGCSDDTAKKVGEMNKSNIQRLANLYAAYQNYNGRGPKSEAEFRTFVSAYDPDKLEMMRINKDDIDSLFKSERDSKPFKIRYGVGGGRGSDDAVIFEQDGAGGTRQVAYTGGKIEDADASTYDALWQGKGTSTPGGSQGGRPSGPPAGAPKGPGK